MEGEPDILDPSLLQVTTSSEALISVLKRLSQFRE